MAIDFIVATMNDLPVRKIVHALRGWRFHRRRIETAASSYHTAAGWPKSPYMLMEALMKWQSDQYVIASWRSGGT